MMTRQQRAKQFQPFDAMKGLQEALRNREETHSRMERHEISQEQQEENTKVLSALHRGDVVDILCYLKFHDMEIRGRVRSLDTVRKSLLLENREIFWQDIYEIRLRDPGDR